MSRLTAYLNQSVPIAPLVTVRVVFGLLMMGSTLRFMYLGWIGDHYLDPLFHFSYPGFAWVKVLPPDAMYAVHGLMVLAALGITLGFWYRVSATVFFLLFTYTELIDLTYYLNHYYFVSLFAGLMILIPAGRARSLDVKQGRVTALNEVPRWTVGILRVQLAVVYVFAGIFKIHSDWLLEALPLRIWLPAHSDLPLLGPLLAQPLAAYLFSWVGMLYDCTIVFFLLWDRSRPWAYLAVILFHLMTGILFQIGVFPVVMIGLTLLFFPAEPHARWQQRLTNRFGPDSQPSAGSPRPLPPWGLALLGAFVLFQLLFPWRFLLYGGQL
ncbi:MAG: HTTM domain-containing protein, partial [Bacteroidetes bacterium]